MCVPISPSTKVGPEVFGLVRHRCASEALASSPELKPWVYCRSTMRMSPSMPFFTIAAIWCTSGWPVKP